LLCTLRRGRRRHRRNTHYQRALPLTWAGLAPAGSRQPPGAPKDAKGRKKTLGAFAVEKAGDGGDAVDRTASNQCVQAGDLDDRYTQINRVA
jgi:hypothetical protein